MIDKLEKKFDSATFAKKIEELVAYHKMDYLEAILFFAEQNNMEVEAVTALVKRSEPIRVKLEAHCVSARLLNNKSQGAAITAFME